MGTIVDTSVLVAAQRDEIDFGALLRTLPNHDVATATICVSELLHGPHRMTNSPAKSAARRD